MKKILFINLILILLFSLNKELKTNEILGIRKYYLGEYFGSPFKCNDDGFIGEFSTSSYTQSNILGHLKLEIGCYNKKIITIRLYNTDHKPYKKNFLSEYKTLLSSLTEKYGKPECTSNYSVQERCKWKDYINRNVLTLEFTKNTTMQMHFLNLTYVGQKPFVENEKLEKVFKESLNNAKKDLYKEIY